MLSCVQILRLGAEYYNKAIQNGWMSINEVTQKQRSLTPVEGGDKHFIQLNMTTIDQPQQPAQNSDGDAV